ncbi:short-subunit dehydrogenase [Thiogranum longum]|uniref:Short-subunit dehydrogenase n=1 Tax=Thiogranum longum TaxID=1537524 RepID=A0A4R1HJF7_9GAMM|nr:SDR family NAD(P)-dependent oxidoreductase [Thiogranum longum]TCK17352.1 short-subunit dehydrogenase [Thiogranum longum]
MTELSSRERSVLITGCSSGIGYCAAHTLHKCGYRVIASARNMNDVMRLQQEGLDCIQLDLDDTTSIAAAVDEVEARTGRHLYALFNNAGFGQPGAVEDLPRDVLRAQFETNVFGTLELTNRILPWMREAGEGRIIQNSSVLGFVSLAYRGAYNASKYALEGLYDTLRLELAGSNIFPVLIEPGPITSRFRENAFAAYQRNIDTVHSVHREAYLATERRLEQKGPAVPFTLPPEAVVDKLLKALSSPRPKGRYYVTFPTYLFGTLKRFLTTRGLDRVLLKVSRNEQGQKPRT